MFVTSIRTAEETAVLRLRTGLHDVARKIHWESCGKPAGEQAGYHASLAIVNAEIERLGGAGFGK